MMIQSNTNFKHLRLPSLLLLLIFLMPITLKAQEDEEQKPEADTSVWNIGQKRVLIVGCDTCEKDTTDGDPPYWGGVDVYACSYLNSDNSYELPDDKSFLERDILRSIGVSVNVFEKRVDIYENYIGLTSGLGLNFYRYSFKRNMRLQSNDKMVWGEPTPNIDYTGNRLNIWYLNVPLLLEVATHENSDKAFHVSLGGYARYRVGSRLKQKYKKDGKRHKNVTWDDYNLNPLQYGLNVRIGFSDWILFADYGLSSMFLKGDGPEVYQISAGMRVTGF